MTTSGQFLWADLSTFHLRRTARFYQDLMGWQLSGPEYRIAQVGSHPTAAIYSMPDQFVAIGMPSFWMSYIAENDIDAVTELARANGGRVEVGPEDFDGGGRFALIRDPLGAGFTVYEGSALDEAYLGRGGRVGHALFVSDAGAVMPFYKTLFGWTFAAEDHGRFRISSDGRALAFLHEIPDEAIRGKEQYWGVLFDAPDVAASRITEMGGRVVSEIELPEGTATLVSDPDGGHFFLVRNRTYGEAERKRLPVLAWLGLGLIGLAVVTGWAWISAAFFLFWIVVGLRDKETFLLQRVPRATMPVTYWVILGSFAALTVLGLIYGF